MWQGTSAASTAAKHQKAIDNQASAHLQLSLPIPVAVGFGVPGASAFFHRFEELVHKPQGGVVEKRLEVVWKRRGAA